MLTEERATTKRRSVELHTVADVSDGNHLSIAEEFSESGVRYLRGQDLSDFFISDADPIYIPDKIYRTLTRSHMLAGDVLVGIVGTIGSVGLVTNRVPRSPSEKYPTQLRSSLNVSRKVSGKIQQRLESV